MIKIHKDHDDQSKKPKYTEEYIQNKWKPITPLELVELVKEEQVQIRQRMTIVDSCLKRLTRELDAIECEKDNP